MPPRKRATGKKKAAYVWGDTPEIVALSRGLADQIQYESGYDRARRFANDTTAKALAVQPGTRNARYAYMKGIPGDVGMGEFVIGMTTPDVISAYGLDDETTLNKAFKQGLLPNDPLMPGFKRSIVNGQPLMKTFHYPNPPALVVATDEWTAIY